MSTPGNYFIAGENSTSVYEEHKRTISEPLMKEAIGNSKERNIESFLNRFEVKISNENIDDVNNDSITINEDIHSLDSMSPLLEDKNVYESIPQSINTPHEDQLDTKFNMVSDHLEKSENVEKIPEVVADFNILLRQVNDRRELFVATPTITTRTTALSHESGNLEKEPQKNLSEFQVLTDQLNKLSATIALKDEEIQKLSHKVLELENKSLKSQRKSQKLSSKYSSSSEDNSVTISDIKDKKIKKKKLAKDRQNKDDKSKDKKNKTDDSSDEKLKEKNSGDNKDNLLINIVDHCNDEMVPALRDKLNELEGEVKRLQQANLESLVSIQDIQNNTPSHQKTPNDGVINQLLIDYSLLKEELEHLKWEHSKLAQPGVLGEEIKELKKEVDALKNQNELLHQYVKSSSTKSLDQGLNTIAARCSFEDLSHNVPEHTERKQKTFNSNNSSDYLYKKLHAKQRKCQGNTNISSMLKHNIESVESPYRISCQSLQNQAPISGGKTYRARKLSDSSSVLVEDVTPKVWLEPVTINCKPKYNDLSNNFEKCNSKKEHCEYDEDSVDSFVSCTTSITETDEDDWKYTSNIRNGKEADLISTADSDTYGNITDRENYKRKPRYSYSFTPKSEMDLTLEDLVKFARPGGKMSTGRVCFIGHLPGRREICVGLELDEDAGKHDGIFEGVRYFQCKRNRGVFISFHKIILAYKSL